MKLILLIYLKLFTFIKKIYIINVYIIKNHDIEMKYYLEIENKNGWFKLFIILNLKIFIN